MKTDLIRRIERERVTSRLDERLSMAWVCQGQNNESWPSLPWLNQGPVAPVRADLLHPVLSMVVSPQDPAFLQLLPLARAGARVYLLVPENWGRQQRIEPEFLQSPTVLIRRVSELPASAILTNGDARVWLGGPWSLKLTEQQAEALRQTFLRLFWHEAFEETWTGEKQLLWNPALQRPFDVPEMLPNASIRIAKELRLQKDVRGAHMLVTSNEVPANAQQKLWFRPGPEHHDKLARLVRQGTEVVWENSELPEMIILENTGEMIVSGAKLRMRIALDAGQAADAKKVLNRHASWSFRVEHRIGDEALRSAKFWLSQESEPRSLVAQQSIVVGDLLAPSLRDMSEISPQIWPEANALALSAKYLWGVTPPKLPPGAAEDALVKRWREIDEQWFERIQRLQETSRQLADNRSRLEKAWSSLAGTWIGFGHTHESTFARLVDLASKQPSFAGPVVAATLFTSLTQLEEDLRRLQKDVDETERREIEEAEKKKQKAEWQKQVESARRDLANRREALGEQDKRTAKIKAELEHAEDKLKRAEGNEKKDAFAQKKKLDDELALAKKQVERLRQEIEAFEQTASRPFEFRSVQQPAKASGSGGARFVPTSTPKTIPVLPEEALPEVGELRVHQKQRYLAIRTWDELDLGEQAALRLEAKLVAMGDV